MEEKWVKFKQKMGFNKEDNKPLKTDKIFMNKHNTVAVVTKNKSIANIMGKEYGHKSHITGLNYKDGNVVKLSFSYLDSFFSISMRPWPFDSINLHTYIEGIGWSVMKISFGLDDNRWWTYYTKLVLNEFLLQSKENPLKTTA